MAEMQSYGHASVVDPNCEGWKLSKTYNPAKDLSVDKEKFYVLQNPDLTMGNQYVSKELGYIGEDDCFHYYSQYKKH